MMYDIQNTFSSNQALAEDAGSYLGDFSADLGSAGTDALGNAVVKDLGRGAPVEVVVQVTTAFTSSGSATVQAQLVMADDAALTSNLVVLDETAAIAVATLVAGYQFRLRAVPQGITKRYLGVRYVIGTATTTAGKCTAFLASSRQSNPAV
jgi:hypothetical protein